MVWLFPPAPLGIFMPDPKIGTRHVPNSTALHSTREFTVVYSIDAVGARRVPAATANRPIVEVLGDSFTFGNGVEDHESYAARLQHRLGPTVAVRNRGVMGWGTTQCMLALRDDLARGDPIRLAVYGWLPFHNQRNYRSQAWLAALGMNGQRLPVFDLVQGQLVFQRLMGPEDGLPDGTKAIQRQEWEITEGAIQEMSHLMAARRSRLLVVLLPFREWMGPPGLVSPGPASVADAYARFDAFLADAGIARLDLWRDARFAGYDLYIPSDMHPTPRWHRLVAEALAQVIDVNAQDLVGASVTRQGPPTHSCEEVSTSAARCAR